MARTLFTADTHFGHTNIIKFCARPFADIETHDRALVECWNSVVAPDDTVWHLGDFAHRTDVQRKRSIFAALNGVKHLIPGNHDDANTVSLPWATVGRDIQPLSIDGRHLVLSHYAMRVWPRSHHGSLNLFGHSHGKIPDAANAVDVGVDCCGYAPTDLPTILARMAYAAEQAPRPAEDEDAYRP